MSAQTAYISAMQRPVCLDQDVTRTSTAAPTDVALAAPAWNGLSVFGLTIAANECLSFEAVLYTTDAANPQNQRFVVTVPVGATGNTGLHATATGSSASTYSFGAAAGAPLLNAIGSGSGSATIHLRGTVNNGANAGNVVLQFAQGASTGVTVTLKKGSTIYALR